METGYKKLDICCDENNIDDGARKILSVVRPKWSPENIKFKHFTEGITNKLVGCYEADKGFPSKDVVLIRIHGANTDLIIDRDTEKNNILLMSEHGLCPPLYGVFKNGIVYGFCPGETLDCDTVKQYRVQIAKEMVKLHSLKPKSCNTRPGLFPKLEQFLKIAPTSFDEPSKQERFSKEVCSIEKLQKEFDILKSTIESMNTTAVMSHNDLLLKNLIYDKTTDKISFIDHEYAMFNYQPYDIGNHFCEYAGVDDVDFSRYPDKEYQLQWLQTYLEEWNKYNGITSPVTDDDVYKLYIQVNKCALVSYLHL